MANPLMMRNNAKKRGTTILIVAIFIALGIATAILAIAAFPTQSFSGSVAIKYKGVGINGEVSATWKVGGETNNMKTQNGETSIVFGAEKIEEGNLSPLDENNQNKEIVLNKADDNVEFTYTFKNYGSNAYTVIMDFTDYSSTNIGVTYKYNLGSYGTTKYGLVVKGVTESSPTDAQGKKYEESIYNIRLKVQDIAFDANFVTDFSWLMETYEPQGDEQLLSYNLNATTFTEATIDGEKTYIASYNGGDISVANMGTSGKLTTQENKVDNIWYVPSMFGSSRVVGVKAGYKAGSGSPQYLPNNTKVILAAGIEEIQDGAFNNDDGLVEIVLQNGLKKIGGASFMGCLGLTEVTIPGSVITWGSDVFANCINLTKATLSEGLNSIGVSAFFKTGLTEITIPNSVISCDINAFNSCTSLTKATLSEGLSSIGEGAFYNTGLTEITIPSSVTSWGFNAFNSCTNLTKVTLSEGLNSIGVGAFYNTGLTEITIPSSVTSIKNDAFNSCRNLTKATLSEGLNSIGTGAFYNTGLKEITIPSGVTEIGIEAFYNSSLTEVTIPSSVTTWGNNVFANCTSLTKATLSEGLNSIGARAFYNTGLTEITIPSSVTEIKERTFYNCTNLTEVMLSDNITTIGVLAFYNCSSLRFINMPKSLRIIEGSGNGSYFAFTRCSIECVYIPTEFTYDMNNFAGYAIIKSTAGSRMNESIPNSIGISLEEFKNAGAKIGDVEYKTFISAYIEAKDGDIIELLRSETFNRSAIEYFSKNVTITSNIEGLELIGDRPFDINGQLTFGEVGSKDIIIKSASGDEVVEVMAGGFLTINAGIIDACNIARCIIVAGSLDMNGGKAINGISADYGAGIYVQPGATMNMTGGEISGNAATVSGGGMLVMGTFTMTGGKICNNTSVESGGGILNSAGIVNIQGGEISNNTASDSGYLSQVSGGGIFVCEGGQITMTAGTIRNNTASGKYSFGGNVHIAKNSSFILSGGIIEGNGSSAAMLGGGVSNIGTFTMTGGTIKNCGAEIGGGVMNLGTATITRGTITGCVASNNAGNNGRAIANNGTLNLGNVTLASGQDIAMGYQKVSLVSSVFPESYGTLNVVESLGYQYTITFVQVTGTLSANVAIGSKAVSHFTGGTVFATYLNGATADASDFTTSGNTFYVNNGNVYMQ